MQKTKEWLILNAVYAWLHHYGDQANAEQYEELKKELERLEKEERDLQESTKKARFGPRFHRSQHPWIGIDCIPPNGRWCERLVGR